MCAASPDWPAQFGTRPGPAGCSLLVVKCTVCHLRGCSCADESHLSVYVLFHPPLLPVTFSPILLHVKQNDLAGILALSNEMHEYSVSEEADQRIDDKVDLLKQCLVHLCVNYVRECEHQGRASGQVVEVVSRGKGYTINTVC